MSDETDLAHVGIDFKTTTIAGLRIILNELETIPVADVKGGRQRTSIENEKIAIIRAILRTSG